MGSQKCDSRMRSPPPPEFDWNDAKYLLAVARHGGTRSAGRVLGVDQSTVQRRLAELERCFGRPLVRRDAGGYRLTDFGQELLPLAQALEAAALRLAQQVDTLQRDLSGVVRVTCPDPIVYRLTHSTLLERFRGRFPGIRVEFVMSDDFLDLRKGEADLALRAGGDDDSLVGRELGASQWAVYASRSYVERHGRPHSPADLSRHALVGLDASKAQHKAATWLREIVPEAHLVARTNSVLGLVYTVKSGVGLAPLPVMLGDGEADLVRVLGPVPELMQTWRLLTTQELRKTPRVAALFEFLVDELPTVQQVLFDPAWQPEGRDGDPGADPALRREDA